MSTAIEVEGLTKRFGDFTAVDQVDFRVQTGEVFGYLGANGAGKSTTIRMLCGLLRPSGGRAEVDGHDVGRSPARVKSRIGYMSQKFSLYMDLPVQSNLRFFAGAYRVEQPEARIEAISERLDIRGLYDSTTGSLPGGTRQRVALACALLHEPSVVFLDEPTAGVDPASRRGFWALIRDLASRGTTIFVTTHYLDEAEGCDRVGLMVDGRLAALDTPAGLKRQHVPGTMLRIRSERRRELRARLSPDPKLEVQSFGRALHVRTEEDPGEVERAVRGIDPEASVEPIEPSLEDVFLRVVRAGGAP